MNVAGDSISPTACVCTQQRPAVPDRGKREDLGYEPGGAELARAALPRLVRGRCFNATSSPTASTSTTAAAVPPPRR